jgi:hypothetical protein
MVFSKSTKGTHVYAALDAGGAPVTQVYVQKNAIGLNFAREDRADDRGRAGGHMNREASSADETAGMEWWNGMSEDQRAYWLREANTAIVAEAWAYYNHVLSQLPD